MKIIPAIDIIGGKCVRLTQGDYAQQKTYNDNPLEVAKSFEDASIQHLHVVDLDGAKGGKIINHKVLQDITANTTLKVDFGGGIKSDADIELAFACGANQITAGSIAVKDKAKVTEWIIKYGADKIILGADVKNETIAISGWQESGNINLYDFLDEYIDLGIQYVICTDIAKDGMLQGPALQLYSDILKRYPTLKLIASGGVAEFEDLLKLADLGLYGAIVGKAFYEGRITLDELTHFADAR
jgi:phosphoribosylformimino-5-aminoimidazole carboxamide ribotide isomerase